MRIPMEYLWKRPDSGKFYYRRAVPDDIKGCDGIPRTEFKISLKTSDLSLAKARFHKVAAEVEGKIENARASLTLVLKKISKLSEIKALADHWEELEKFRIYNDTSRVSEYLTFTTVNIHSPDSGPSNYNAGEEYPVIKLDLVSEAVDSQDEYNAELRYLVIPIISETLAAQHYEMPSEEDLLFKQLLTTFEKAYRRVASYALQIYEGCSDLDEVKSPAPIHKHKKAASSSISLSEAFKLWERELYAFKGKNSSTIKTADEFKAAVYRFIEFGGDVQITDITTLQVTEYSHLLLRLPARPNKIARGLSLTQQATYAEKNGLATLSHKTALKNLKAIATVINMAKERMGIKIEEPIKASGIYKALNKGIVKNEHTLEDEKEYSRLELRAIFQSPVYTEGWRPKTGYGEAFYWLPLIFAYTGARLEEIAQLMVSDIKRETEHDFWYISIKRSSEHGQRVKNNNSIRNVPLHPDLIELGFIDYCRSIPAKGRLWPEMTVSSTGSFGYNFGRVWGRYLKNTAGIITSAKPNHGFRHAFKTLCRSADIRREFHERLTGHTDSKRSVGDSYGSIELHVLYRELKKFPSIATEAGLLPKK